MAKLIFKAAGADAGAIELNWGLTRIGRGPSSDVQIDHPTISSWHCEITLSGDVVVVRDCGSTNGTFIDGQPVREGRLEPGHTLRLGDVELVLERDQARVSVPLVEPPKLPESQRLGDGSLSCLNHIEVRATHECQQCHRVFCPECVRPHDLKVNTRRRRIRHIFCPRCGGECHVMGEAGPRRKRSFIELLQDTLARPFRRGGANDR